VRVGFVGLPPEGATPSRPEVGELVLSLQGAVGGPHDPHSELWVYADGRMIWARSGNGTVDVPEGANAYTTGYLEQRLAPEGVELLRSTILSTGLFEHDLTLDSGNDAMGLLIQVRDGDRIAVVSWSPSRDSAPRATQAQAVALVRLADLLTDPKAWLPEGAWIHREIRAFVASRYDVIRSLVAQADGSGFRLPDPSRLPHPADELLEARASQCVTTDEARAIVEGFGAAGIEPSAGFWQTRYLAYDIQALDEGRLTLLFSPALPHFKSDC
jgi:hypothetical protein